MLSVSPKTAAPKADPAPAPSSEALLQVQLEAADCRADGSLDAGQATLLATRALEQLAACEVTDAECDPMSINLDLVGRARLGDLVEAKGYVTRRTRTVLFLTAELFVGSDLVVTATSVFRINHPK